MSQSAITIVDLAEKIGLSKSTVSRALSDYSDISDATKKRVVEAAELYGYRPSSHAQSIKTGVVRSVALVLSVSKDTVQKASLADLLDGISSRLGQDQWTLTVATAADDKDDLDVQRMLIEEKKVDGFIIPRVKFNDPRIALMNSYDMPFVVYGRGDLNAKEAFFDIRTENSMAEAVLRFFGAGHSRIGYIGTNDNYVMHDIRENGYRNGLDAVSLPFDESLIRNQAMTQETGMDAAMSLLTGPKPPTAIVCAMDAAALGVYKAAANLGLKIGQDVSVIGYDGIPEGSYVQPPLTTYSNDSRKAGIALAELLLKRIRGEDAGSLRLLADPVFVKRESDGPPMRSSEELAAKIAAGCIQTQREILGQ